MRVKGVFGIIGMLLLVVGGATLIPFGVAVYEHESRVAWSFLATMMVLVGGGGSLSFFLNRKQIDELTHREGVLTMGFGWLVVCLCGALPYLFSGALTSVPDALFESFSGFTTTGATIISDIEAMPRGILMWRALSHWLGGIGIIVMFLSMLPFLGIGGAQVYRLELPEFFGERVTPRVSESARVLCTAYFLFTIVLFWLLFLGGMNAFDAVCHTFTIVASGGFANYNDSMASYTSPFLQWVMIIFMFLTGMNYAVHYKLLHGNLKSLLRDEEFRFYFLIVLVFTLIVTMFIAPQEGPLAGGETGNSFRTSAFQVVSIMSTTGLTTADYTLWPMLPQALLLVLMFIGGCGGSTSGGFKCMRVLLLLKCVYDELVMLLHPRAVRRLKMSRASISNDVVNSILHYLVIYLLGALICAILLAAMNLDLLTAFSSALSCISCVGPAFGLPGADGNFAEFPGLAKIVLSLGMLLGRIEFYAVLVLCMPTFWRE
ncbi:MAG: TrkH family potassium uptake protein [Desulfovibrionaceae bacterium]|nr:TrkH family potassium uptake protein [Desulfovibrionaceae bacterium]